MFEFGQDPNDPYEHKQSETKLTSTQDGYEELFVRDNIDQIPSNLDNLGESEMQKESEDAQKKKKKKRRNNKCKKQKQSFVSNDRGLTIETNMI